MKYTRRIRATAIALTISLVLANFAAYAAVNFRDVASDHWAYNAISRIAERGLILGDASGNYKPNDYIDKFETAKIFAKAAGYKYTGVTPEEQVYYDRAYEKNRDLIQQYAKAYTKWNPTADREIAYLLEKEIMTVDDLNQFMLKDNKNAEQFRALSRQEVSVFLVKLMSKKTDALSGVFVYDFKDDAKISNIAKPYVYYLKKMGVISGYDGNFDPNGAVTRAAMAVFLDNTLTLLQAPEPTPTASVPVSKVETISGTIDKIYPTLSAIQILSAGDKRNIYKMSVNASIYVDSYLKTFADLKEGMPIVGVLTNNDLVDLRAQSVTTGTTIEPETNLQLSRLEGLVSSISNEVTGRVIGIEIRMLNPRGDIITDIRSYVLSNDCKISRGDYPIDFNTIIVGDVITAEISGSKVYSIYLEEKSRRITNGILLEKKFVDLTNTPIFVIQDANGKKLELRVTNSTVISRKNFGNVSWSDIRVGDIIEANAEFDKLIDVYATGIKTSAEGTIEEIYIDRNKAVIALKNSNAQIIAYNIINGSIDVYTLRVGSKVKLNLDSQEVESIQVLESVSLTNVTGSIQALKTSSFVFREESGGYAATREIYLDTNSIIMDSKTGGRLNYGNLVVGMKVYIVLASNTGNVAKTITVLSN